MREKFINAVRNSGKEVDSRHLRGLEIANKKTFGFPPLLQNHIIESTHFKMMMGLETIEQILDEIYRFAETVEPYMQVGSTSPSALFCVLYRLMSFGLNGHQLRRLIESRDHPYIRCVGFLFVRFGLAPEQVWPWLGEYVLDDEEVQLSKDSDFRTTIGEYVEGLLTEERYCSTVLPRFPVTTKRKLEEKLAQVPQYRKRTTANLEILDRYREADLKVEVALLDG